MTTESSSDADDVIDLRVLLNTLVQHWYWIVGSALLAVLLGWAYLRVTLPVYSTTGMIQVQDSKNTSAALLGGELADLVAVQSPANTEIELLKSTFVLGQAIQNLKLDLAVRNREDRLGNRLQHRPTQALVHSDHGVFYRWNDSYLELASLEVPEALLDQDLLLIVEGQRYRLQWQDQDLLSGTLHSLQGQISPYGLVRIRINQATAGQQFLIRKKSLQTAVQDVQASLAVAEKGKLTGILGLTYQGTNPLLIQQTLNEIMRVYTQQNFELKSVETKKTLAFLEQQLPDLKKQLEEAERRFNIYRRSNNTIDVSKESELLLTQNIDLKTKRIELEQKLAELQARYTSDYPLMAEVKKQLDAIGQENLKVEQRLNQLPEIQRQYLQLYRDVQVNTELYTKLLNSYEQLKVVRASQMGNVRVVDWSQKPLRPVKPKPALVLMLSLLLGGMLGVMLVLLNNLLFRGIKSSQDIEQQLGVSVLATVPRSLRQWRLSRRKGQSPLLAAEDGEDMSVEALRSLRTLVHFANPGDRVFLVAGPAPMIGKSFLTANFAAVLSQTGRSVVLVDADMRRGHLHDYFGGSRDQGLSEFLQGKVTDLDQICRKTSLDNMDFIATGAIPPNPAELLLHERFSQLLETLQQHYDFVLLDSPPLLAATDGVIIGRQAGLTLMVARYGKTNLNELALAHNRLKQAGVNVLGVVFNDVQREGHRYDAYQYGYQYRSRDQ